MRWLSPLLVLVVCLGAARAEVRVNDVTRHDQTLPAVAATAWWVYVAYQDNSEWRSAVKLAVSDDMGLTFKPAIQPSEESTADQTSPDIALDEAGLVLAVWADFRNQNDFDIFFGEAGYEGESFQRVRRVHEASGATQVEPAIAVDGANRIYVAWADSRRTTAEDSGVRWDVRLATSGNRGRTFTPSVKLNPDDDVYALYPDLAGTADGVAAVWFDRNFQIWARVARDGGATWDDPVVISGPSEGRSDTPRVTATINGRIAVVWNDDRESDAGRDPTLVDGSGRCNDVYIATSDDGGVTWTAPARVNSELNLNQQNPAISFDGDLSRLFIAWSDDRTVGNFTLQGVFESRPWAWPAPDDQLDGYAGVARRDFPDLQQRAIVWQDDRDGDWDIYFAWLEGAP